MFSDLSEDGMFFDRGSKLGSSNPPGNLNSDDQSLINNSSTMVNYMERNESLFTGTSSASATTNISKRMHSSASSASMFAYSHKSRRKAYSPTNKSHSQHNNAQPQTFRCIQGRIESARKLVKKLQKLCPFYQVSFMIS